ncbi:MAG: GNAT family N-acyltransferase [Patescibacteria group bacterium]|jgi:N-acyl-L-homoserine lactone synthetase
MQIIKKLLSYIEFVIFIRTFSHRFSFYTTTDTKELDEIYQLRYQVYCVECEYISKELHPDKREHDEYDDNSTHFILRDQRDNIAATVRLIHDSSLRFPLEKHFNSEFNVSEPERNKIVEISRLIVASRYRKKFLLLALMKGIFAYTKFNNLNYVYCVLDERLYKVLTKMGFPLRRIGPSAAYQGLTTPYIMEIGDMLENLRSVNNVLFEYLTSGIMQYNNKENHYTIS